MTVQSQSGKGRIEFYDDFGGPEIAVAGTTAGPLNFPPFVVFGTGIDINDSGVVTQTTLLGGVIRLTTTDLDNNYCKVGTSPIWDVALMAPLVVEARIQMSVLTNRRVFVGFSNGGDTTSAVEFEANAGTVTNTMTSFAGILFDSGATSSNYLYGYNGGTTAAKTTEQDTGVTPVAGEWDTLRVEIFDNGDVRFFVNAVLVASVAKAISTTTDLGGYVGVGGTTTTIATCDVDYLLVSGSRDWTR